MTVILLRTVIFYLVLTFMVRLMGKRQISEMQISDLVAAMMLSELAALPVTDKDIPLIHGIIAVTALGCIEVIVSFVCSRIPRFRKLLYGEPILLVAHGKLMKTGMQKARVSPDEVVAAIRSQGLENLNQVKFVILEQNGSMSVIQKG